MADPHGWWHRKGKINVIWIPIRSESFEACRTVLCEYFKWLKPVTWNCAAGRLPYNHDKEFNTPRCSIEYAVGVDVWWFVMPRAWSWVKGQWWQRYVLLAKYQWVWVISCLRIRLLVLLVLTGFVDYRRVWLILWGDLIHVSSPGPMRYVSDIFSSDSCLDKFRLFCLHMIKLSILIHAQCIFLE